VLELGAGGDHLEHSRWQWNSGIWLLLNCVVSTMLLKWCCTLNIFNAEKSTGGRVKKSITSSFSNRITFYLTVRCRRFLLNKVLHLYAKIPNRCWENSEKIKGPTFLPHPVDVCYLWAEREQDLHGIESLMLYGVLDGKLSALATARVVNVCAGSGQFSYRAVWVCVVDRAEVRQVQRRAAVLAMWFVYSASKSVGPITINNHINTYSCRTNQCSGT